MKFEIVMEIDQSAIYRGVGTVIHDIMNALSNHLASRFYGSGIDWYLVGFTVVNPPAACEHFFKERRPSFKKDSFSKKLNIAFGNVLSYDINIRGDKYNYLMSCDINEFKKAIAIEFVDAISKVEKLFLKINDFDSKLFTEDVISFFKAEGYIE